MYSSHYDEQFLEADKLISDGLIKEALEILSQIINEQPDFGRAHNHLGWIYEQRLKYYDKAEQHYKASIQFSPEYPAGWLNYIYLLTNQRRFDELVKYLEKAMKVRGIYKPYLWNEYASMHELSQNFDSAIHYYNKAIMDTLNKNEIEGYEESIARCEKKRPIL